MAVQGRGGLRMQTRITKLLGIQHPIVLPGMSWISKPQLVAAVSNAGGLGILATGPLTAKETAEAIREIRRLTDKPFGIGCTLMMPGAKENVLVALEEEVPVINYSLGKGDWLAERAHGYGGKVIATVTTAKHAQSAKQSGADALQVTGHEAAAHGGDVTSLVLIPSIRARVDLPIIAAGGFGTGQGLLAALSLGADAVAMGTRFACTQESPLHENVKKAIAQEGMTESDTLYSKNFDGIWARVMKTPRTEAAAKRPMNPVKVAVEAMKAAGRFNINPLKILPGLFVDFPKIYMLASFGAATKQFEAATIDGDLDGGIQFVGQVQGLIDDVPTVDALVQRVLAEAHETHSRNGGVFVGKE